MLRYHEVMARRASQQVTVASFSVDLALESAKKQDLEGVQEALEQARRALSEVSKPEGVSVSYAGKVLGVSEPTVRRWIDRGVLAKVPGQSPTELKYQSVTEVHQVLEELRAKGLKRDWLQAVVDYLDDRDAREQAGVGRKKFDRNDYVPA